MRPPDIIGPVKRLLVPLTLAAALLAGCVPPDGPTGRPRPPEQPSQGAEDMAEPLLDADKMANSGQSADSLAKPGQSADSLAKPGQGADSLAKPGQGPDSLTKPGQRADSPAKPGQRAEAGCPEEGARIELTEVDAAMGLRAMGLYLVNCGDRPYQVEGYPVVLALGADKKPLDVRILRGGKDIAGGLPPDRAPTVVLLQPGERAGAAIFWRNTYDDITHPPVNAPYLRIAPGIGRPAQILTPDGPVDLGSTGRLGVGAWQPAGPRP